MLNFTTMGCHRLTYWNENTALEKNKTPLKSGVDYYPFGLSFNQQTRENTHPQNYQYNGKELQTDLDLNWMDYGARMYMADIGRWNGIDASAENYINQSPYLYAGNNPIKFVDFDGNDYGIEVDRGSKTITIKAHFLTSSKTSKAFNLHGRDKWNGQSGKNVFVVGGVKRLRNSLKSGGNGNVYTINIKVTSEVQDGENVINERTVESNTPRDEAANADVSGTVNSFDTVTEFSKNDNQNGGTSNNEVDVKSSELSSGTTTHETSHAMGIGHNTQKNGTISIGGGSNVGKSQIGESLKGVGIGGNTIARNSASGIGDGSFLNGSNNSGLKTGKVISTKRYNRIVKRIQRKLNK